MAIPHDTDNYTIGKGVLSIGAWDGNTPPASLTDVGNAPSVEVEHTLERLPHYSSRSGLKVKDKNPVIQADYVVNFVLDEIAAENLVLFVAGTQEEGVIHALQVPDAEYQLKFVSDNPFGPNRTYWFWKATLTPNGPMTLIGEEWMQMSFMAEGVADTVHHESSPYYDITFTTTTTTSSTTSSTTSTTTTTEPP